MKLFRPYVFVECRLFGIYNASDTSELNDENATLGL